MNPAYETTARLNQLKDELIARTPYYNRLRNVRSFYDLPFMSKIQLNAFLPEFEARLEPEHLHVHYTSGTTGIPLKCIKTRSEQVRLAANLYEYRRPYGLPRNHKMLLLSDRSLLLGRTPEMEQRLLDSYIHKLQSASYDFIQGRCSVLYKLATRLLDLQVDLRFPPLFTQNWGEYYHPNLKGIIEQAFRAPSLDYYGMEEMWGIAFTNADGQLEVDERSVFVEIVDQDQRPVDGEDTYGEIVVTSFLMRSIPFVRYRTGDIGRVRRNARTGKLIIELLPVRSNQVRLADRSGQAFDSVFRFLDDLFSELYRTIGLRQFQMIQHAHTDFELLIIAERQPDLALIHDRAAPLLRLCAGEEVQLRVTRTDEIAPNAASGKYQSFITKI